MNRKDYDVVLIKVRPDILYLELSNDIISLESYEVNANTFLLLFINRDNHLKKRLENKNFHTLNDNDLE